jgi:hypothetical protein
MFPDITNQNNSAELVTKIAAEISRRKLIAPAIFALEMYKPIYGLFREGAVASAPILYPLVGGNLYNALCSLLNSSENIESLILKLESLRESSHGC